ncbi:MAG: tetratricopeptide repeat protein [Candidatus Sericytochromatia bacterium]
MESTGSEAPFPLIRPALADKQTLLRLYRDCEAWLQQGRFAEARAVLTELVQRNPEKLEFLNNLVALCRYGGDTEAALVHAHTAFLLAPTDHTAQVHLGHLLLEQKRYVQAGHYYQLATGSDPQDAEAWENLAHCLGKQGQIRPCLEVLGRATQLQPADARLKSAFLYHLLALPGLSPEQRWPHLQAWDRSQSRPALGHSNSPEPARRLRIGYVSADLRQSVAAQVFGPLFFERDRGCFELYVYSNHHSADAETESFRADADHWREIHALSDAQVVDLIQQDQIDVLVDLNSLMEGNRLAVFAARPAPIQLTGPGGYIGSTGLSAIGYCLADAVMIPPEQACWHSESPLYLSSGFHWQPRAEYADLSAADPPGLTGGRFTLGCGNDTLKLNPAVLGLWAELLRLLPEADLLLKAPGLEEFALQEHFQQFFVRSGVAPERIRCEGSTPPRAHLDFYRRCDLILDPFPFNGAISTCDALWMGRPVIVRDGGHRVGASILTAVGLSDWIAADEADYLRKACILARAPQRVSPPGLRERLLASPICDGKGFCAQVEGHYRRLWEAWCLKQASA